MALSIFHLYGSLHLITAYENGAAVAQRANPDAGEWITLYKHQAHSQPILSFDVSPCFSYFITSSADAIIAKHPIPQDGAPSSSFPEDTEKDKRKAPEQKAHEPVTTPLKSVNTKHSGQQGLKIRSDGTIFATAGWDSKVRVYSAKSLKEVAVLKWHQSGCYTVAFATINPATSSSSALQITSGPGNENDKASESQRGQQVVSVSQSRSLAGFNIRDRRINQARTAHWIAAGSKDGKVSLWDIY